MADLCLPQMMCIKLGRDLLRETSLNLFIYRFSSETHTESTNSNQLVRKSVHEKLLNGVNLKNFMGHYVWTALRTHSFIIEPVFGGRGALL